MFDEENSEEVRRAYLALRADRPGLGYRHSVKSIRPRFLEDTANILTVYEG
jgi:hypothetical protein